MKPLVVARGVVKRYGAFTAVDGVSFQVMEGECFGILGPNGAGKTTLVRLMASLSPLTAGQITVDGLDVSRQGRQVRARIGLVPQHDNLDPELTAWQNLRVFSRYFGVPKAVAEERAGELLDFFHLRERARQRVETLSAGMRRRLIIARALINAPRLLVLDEPTTGLDPQARHLLWQRLRQLKTQGVTMVLTTHYMEEAEQLCDRLIIVHEGRVLAEGSPQALVERYAGREVAEVHLAPFQDEAPVLSRLTGASGLVWERAGDVLFIYARDSDGLDPALLRGMGERVVLRRANLEDVFLRLTGRGLAE
ncbi:MAG: ABC transporter ATP-binding protein [Dehalococcoidia bacterium]|nr:ABC transporter ATP-binding protein [Dehalococcoidia bacterium]MDW8008185.1 ABC transporter ATP-binding protein [Chloroflexota bacterium]